MKATITNINEPITLTVNHTLQTSLDPDKVKLPNVVLMLKPSD